MSTTETHAALIEAIEDYVEHCICEGHLADYAPGATNAEIRAALYRLARSWSQDDPPLDPAAYPRLTPEQLAEIDKQIADDRARFIATWKSRTAFDEVYRALADQGKTDGAYGAEYRRVRVEWEAAGSPLPVDPEWVAERAKPPGFTVAKVTGNAVWLEPDPEAAALSTPEEAWEAAGGKEVEP